MSSRVYSAEIIRDRLLVLSTLNVTQPMTLNEIMHHFAKRMEKRHFNLVFNTLVRDGYVRKIDKERYILSYHGIQAFARSPLKRSRDIQRMLFLNTVARRGEE